MALHEPALLAACIHQPQIHYSSDEGLCSTDSTSQLNIWARWGSSKSVVASSSIVTDLFGHQSQPDTSSTNGAGQSVFKTNEGSVWENLSLLVTMHNTVPFVKMSYIS